MIILTFDLETTGTNPQQDRICQIACVATSIGSTRTKDYKSLVKPGIPIPSDATKIHGITNEHVLDAPTFQEIWPEIREAFVNDAQALSGFNIRKFDIPLLLAEIARLPASKEYNRDEDIRAISAKVIMDASEAYRHFNPRTLEAAYRQYTGKTIEGAHDAMVDTAATSELLFAMMHKHEELREVSFWQSMSNAVDVSGLLIKNQKGEVVFNFGKHIGKKVSDNKPYAEWMLKNDFPIDTKNQLRKLI